MTDIVERIEQFLGEGKSIPGTKLKVGMRVEIVLTDSPEEIGYQGIVEPPRKYWSEPWAKDKHYVANVRLTAPKSAANSHRYSEGLPLRKRDEVIILDTGKKITI